MIAILQILLFTLHSGALNEHSLVKKKQNFLTSGKTGLQQKTAFILLGFE